MSDPRRADDDVLVRRLDDQPLTGDPHPPGVAEADGSGDRLWELREASSRFSSLVADLPVAPTPPLRLAGPRPARRALRAAIVALLAFAGAAAAMPTARSAILDALGAVVSAGSLPAAGEPGAGGTSVTFVPSSDSFSIEVRSAQTDGALVVRRGAAPTVTAEAGGAAELIVLPSGLVVVNPASSTSDVIVRLPESVSRLSVTVAEAPVETGSPWSGAPLRVPLSGRRR